MSVHSSESSPQIPLTQRREEPPILPARVPVLQQLFHRLLCILPLADLLECVIRHHALQTLQFQRVSCRHQVVIVNGLDKGLDL